MHHFIYPAKDTFITNVRGFDNLNFGLDETLRVGTQNITTKITYPTTVYPFPPNTTVTNLCVKGYSGSLATASLFGSASTIIGKIFNSVNEPVSLTTDFFSGSIVGNVVGWENGNYISSSNFSGSLFDFSGSIFVENVNAISWDEIIYNYENWQNIWEDVLNGSGSINGYVSGTFSSSYFSIFNGSILDLTGKILTGKINGANVEKIQHSVMAENLFANRALVQFDISSISKSISNGDIPISDVKFKLKMNVAREMELPITYNLYAFPISESWSMGDGYISDDGSSVGASWIYRDRKNGTPWASSGSTYINSMCVSQSFNYQVGDVDMDITSIVVAWLNGTIENNGIVIIISDEFSPTGSGMGLYFFSKDTNTIYSPVLDVGWNDVLWSTGSVSVDKINIGMFSPGLTAIVSDGSQAEGALYGGFKGYANINIVNETASGLIAGVGITPLITSMSIVGNMSASVSRSINTVYKTCSSCPPDFNSGFENGTGHNNGYDVYGWNHNSATYNQYEWFAWGPYQVEFGPEWTGNPYVSGSCTSSMVSMSFLMGTFIDGQFSGSTFTASLISGCFIPYGYLVGGWDESMLVGSQISAQYPFKPIYPNAINVQFTGSFINGPAFGSITNYTEGISGSGIFDGVFTGGQHSGIHIHTPFSGSLLTSSVAYTSSIVLTSSSLSPVNTQKPFTTVVQNIPTSVKAGDVIRVNVFARPEFPLKNFNRQSQFTQFLIPQYLPTTSYYAIKDNETEQIIVNFDNYTQLSCDQNGNYFMLDTTGFPQERYFRILIKTMYNGSIYTFDKGNIFKIVR